ncbi:MAG: HAMP domain-containing sensor histidine kinase, partial [Thermoanaerobaculia bacterium]
VIPRIVFPEPPELRPSSSGCFLVRFDLDFIRQTLAPELGVRYLAWGDELEFDYGIFSRGDAASHVPVYLSDPRLPPRHYLEGDRRVGLFGPLSRESLRDLWLQRGTSEPRLSRPPRGRRWFSAPAAGRRGPPASGSWLLAVRHPEGSLEAAVTRVRRRNLAVSSGVLLLLGLTVAMLLVSVGRARELAARRVELAAGITHELRTPLAAIRALAQNLADGIVDKPDQARRYGAQIERQSARLSAMVEQSLELSGILSERQTYVFEPVAAVDAVTAAMADCRPLLADGGCFETRFADGLPLVDADAAALQKAIQNLITNAIKYGGDDRWVGIEVSCSTGAAGREVAVQVSDHGPGIPSQEQPRLFDAFYRSRDATEAQVPGSGLGLSLVKHVVDAHRGRIDVRSEPGRGSTFTILLPASEIRDGEP